MGNISSSIANAKSKRFSRKQSAPANVAMWAPAQNQQQQWPQQQQQQQQRTSRRLSIVSFNSIANRHTPLRKMDAAGKDEVSQSTLRLTASGGTSIAAGLDCGIANMEQRRQRNPVGAIFLLTDGQDHGSRTEIPQLIDRARAAQCAVYAFGFGQDHDTSVLSAISESAQTPFTFVEKLDTVKEAFAGAVGGLMSVVAQSIELRIVPEAGCALAAIHTHFTCRREAGQDGPATVLIPDAFAGERRDIVVELRVPTALEGAEDEQAPLLRASARYRTVNGRALTQTPEVCLEAARSMEPEGEPDAEVTAQRQRIEVTNVLERAIAQGEEGRFDEAQEALKSHASQLRNARVKTHIADALLAEMEDAQDRLSSSSAWSRGGHAEVSDAMWMHRHQRCTNATISSGAVMKCSKAMYLHSAQAESIKRSKR